MINITNMYFLLYIILLYNTSERRKIMYSPHVKEEICRFIKNFNYDKSWTNDI